MRVFDLFLKGCFGIPSLAGSFIPSDSEGIKNRAGGMSVSLSSSNGRVVGGSVAGLLVAASCSKIRRPPRNQNSIIITITTRQPVWFPFAFMQQYLYQHQHIRLSQTYSAKQNLSLSSFRGDSWSSIL